MGLAHVVGTEAGRHRFHTLAVPGKQQAGAIGLQRAHAIQVPRGLRQAIQIGREAFLLGAWRNRMGAHDQQLNIQEWQTGWSFSSRYPVYNTVVLGGSRWRLRRTRCAMGFQRQSVAESSTGRTLVNGDGGVVMVDRPESRASPGDRPNQPEKRPC